MVLFFIKVALVRYATSNHHHHPCIYGIDSSLFRSENRSISWKDLSYMSSLTLQNIDKDMTMEQKDAPKYTK